MMVGDDDFGMKNDTKTLFGRSKLLPPIIEKKNYYNC
jgi:hypothetical protein